MHQRGEINFGELVRKNMVVFYIALFGSMNLLVYLLVNRVILPNFKNISLVVLYGAVLTIIHTGFFFKSKLLLSLEDFVFIGSGIIGSLIITFASKISARNLAKSTLYTEDAKRSFTKLHRFLFLKVIYVAMFIVQVFFLIALGKQDYTNW